MLSALDRLETTFAEGDSAATRLLNEHWGSHDANVCPFCGEDPHVELHEVWAGRDFQIDACCEGMHEFVCNILSDDAAAADVMRMLEIDHLGLGKLRRVVDNDMGGLVLDWNLRVCTVKQAVAKRFIIKHHAHCKKAPAGWRFGAGLMNGSELIGVMMVGRPVARAIDHTQVVEVNRLCISRDVHQALVWNGCSMLYSHAAREAKRRGFSEIITYLLGSEAGTSLKAAGWECEGDAGGGSWSCKSRPRVDQAPTERKTRWRRVLRQRPSAARPVQPLKSHPARASAVNDAVCV